MLSTIRVSALIQKDQRHVRLSIKKSTSKQLLYHTVTMHLFLLVDGAYLNVFNNGVVFVES